ncbi:hypothetical protein AB0G67_23415 [Streptomyces sp. NPDC021056]|uniref:hypothetical protein n=1 Tax=Streptomyces sp. NPDC021056 TaxID=3155012 RepID=UPI0033EDE1A0
MARRPADAWGLIAWEMAGPGAAVTGIVLLGLHPAMPCGTAERPVRTRDLQPN